MNTALMLDYHVSCFFVQVQASGAGCDHGRPHAARLAAGAAAAEAAVPQSGRAVQVSRRAVSAAECSTTSAALCVLCEAAGGAGVSAAHSLYAPEYGSSRVEHADRSASRTLCRACESTESCSGAWGELTAQLTELLSVLDMDAPCHVPCRAVQRCVPS